MELPRAFGRALRDLRNRVDFFLRSRVRLGRDVDAAAMVAQDAPLQAEFGDCLSRFDWRSALTRFSGRDRLVVADVGCRTFHFAPVLERCFATHGFRVEPHGIELDAFRRFTDLRTRQDHGRFWAAQVEAGRYHAIDVREFREPLDVAFLLNPFVTREPLLRWGLPLRTFAPEAIFDHLAALLRPRRGLLYTSNPTEEELTITRTIAQAAGFSPMREQHWQAAAPSESTDRWCALWSAGVSAG